MTTKMRLRKFSVHLFGILWNDTLRASGSHAERWHRQSISIDKRHIGMKNKEGVVVISKQWRFELLTDGYFCLISGSATRYKICNPFVSN